MSDPVDPVAVYVQGFLATFGNDCGKRLYEIATMIGITVTEVDAESFEGALIRIVGAPKGKIAINANIREPARKRFTLAHELGHYVQRRWDDAADSDDSELSRTSQSRATRTSTTARLRMDGPG